MTLFPPQTLIDRLKRAETAVRDLSHNEAWNTEGLNIAASASINTHLDDAYHCIRMARVRAEAELTKHCAAPAPSEITQPAGSTRPPSAMTGPDGGPFPAAADVEGYAT